MLFQNYGLFWNIDRVKWGSRGKGNEGTLTGCKAVREGPVDFRRQRGVYALYDHNYALLYIGQAGYGQARLYDRLSSHRWGGFGERIGYFSFFGIDPVVRTKTGAELQEVAGASLQVNEALDHMEAIAIAVAGPTLNKQGGRFGKAESYWQHFEDDDDDYRAELTAIGDRLASIEKIIGRNP